VCAGKGGLCFFFNKKRANLKKKKDPPSQLFKNNKLLKGRGGKGGIMLYSLFFLCWEKCFGGGGRETVSMYFFRVGG